MNAWEDKAATVLMFALAFLIIAGGIAAIVIAINTSHTIAGQHVLDCTIR